MAVEIGDYVTADLLNALRPAEYSAKASGTVAASSTNVDVPGCTVTFDTLTNGATVKIDWVGDFDASGAPTIGVLNSVRAIIDGATTSPSFAMFASGVAEASGQRQTDSQTWTTTIATAGSHTIKLQATTTANMVINTMTNLNVKVTEVI